MWDLDTLTYLNDQAYRKAVKRARQDRKAKSASSPLVALGNKLLARRIPSLSSLVAQISDAENYAQFVQMVKTYLPERTQDILHEPTPQSQIARFASYFEDRYFPLEEIFKIGDLEGYSEITSRIPVMVLGFSYDDYHETPDWQSGDLLLTYLIENPWEGEEGIYVSMAEACSEHVSEALIKRADAADFGHYPQISSSSQHR
jgi:hypothetical protein